MPSPDASPTALPPRPPRPKLPLPPPRAVFCELRSCKGHEAPPEPLLVHLSFDVAGRVIPGTCDDVECVCCEAAIVVRVGQMASRLGMAS